MCASTMSLVAKPCIRITSNGRPKYKKFSATKTTRAQAIAEPEVSKPLVLHRPTEKGIPQADQRVREIVEKQSQRSSTAKEDACSSPQFHPMFLDEAYERCRIICAEYAKTFYLGTTSFIYSSTKKQYFSF